MAIIQARGLRKHYGDFVAVDGIDFAVAPGEFFGILGPNGAGKTTTIRMITCTTPLTAGELTVDDLDVRFDDREIKARIGVAPQDDNLDEDLSVRKNLEIYSRYFDIPREVAAERIADGLELMQLSDWAGASIHTLSGGMKRRLVVARALINEPRVLILDEPTTGLDPQARHLVWRKLRRLRERGLTLVLTSHYMEEAEQLCDRLIVMDHGKILDEGRPRDLIQKHVGSDVLEMRLEADEVERVAPIIAPMLQNGARREDVEGFTYIYGASPEVTPKVEAAIGDPYRVTQRRANLEDVFLTLTGRALDE